MRQYSRAGFSAFELFVALSMVVISGGIVMTVNRHAVPAARASSCTSNCRQIALSLRAYCTDWDYPPTGPRGFNAMQPYVKNTQLFTCPAQYALDRRNHVDLTPNAPGGLVTDYLLNPQVRMDDAPGIIVIGDDQPNRHMGRYWIGARLDGACFLWPAREWEGRLGGVVTDATPDEA